MLQHSDKKRIAIFGSTGSIGTQALDVIEANPDLFTAEILTANANDQLLIQQALKFQPNIVVIGDERKYQKVKEALASTDIKVFTGEQALEDKVEFSQVLMIDQDGNLTVGNDVKAIVKAEIVSQVKGDKVIAFKMKRRKGFRKKHGHRTHFTKIKVTEIA